MLSFLRYQKWKKLRLIGFCFFLLKRFNEVQVLQVSASLTFTTLLAIVPVLTVTVVVVSAFPMFSSLSNAFVHFINQTIVPQGADAVFNYIEQFKGKATNLSAIGALMLLVTSLMLIRTIDQTFNRIWHVKVERPIWTQFLVYWALLTFGPLAIGISASSWSLLMKYSHFNETFPLLAQFTHIITSFIFSTILLWLLYLLVPNRFVPAKHALLGASITAILLEIARSVFAWYISTFNGYTLIYGAFAAIPFFLLWLNLLWTFILTGAVFTAALSYWRGQAFLRDIDARGRFDDVLKILLLLDEAQQKGITLKVQNLRNHINMGYDELGELLEQLAKHNYVYQGKQGWVLKTNAKNIEINELFKLFVYHPSPNNQDEVNNSIKKIMQPSLDSMNISLAEFNQHTKQNK